MKMRVLMLSPRGILWMISMVTVRQLSNSGNSGQKIVWPSQRKRDSGVYYVARILAEHIHRQSSSIQGLVFQTPPRFMNRNMRVLNS